MRSLDPWVDWKIKAFLLETLRCCSGFVVPAFAQMVPGAVGRTASRNEGPNRNWEQSLHPLPPCRLVYFKRPVLLDYPCWTSTHGQFRLSWSLSPCLFTFWETVGRVPTACGLGLPPERALSLLLWLQLALSWKDILHEEELTDRHTVHLRNWLFARHTKIGEVNCITLRKTIQWAMFIDNGKIIWAFKRKFEFWKPCVCPMNFMRLSLKTLGKYWWWYMNVILCYNIIKFINI